MAKGDRYDVFVVQEGKDERGDAKNFWKEVGVAFENSDGSLGLRLHLFPDLTMQVRKHVRREERDERPAQRDNRNTGRGRR